MQSCWCGLLAGTNSFDNIRWFNKELSDTSLNKTILLLALAGKTADFANIQKFNKLLAAAKTKAAYKCELMLKEFEPKLVVKKTAKSASSKNATKTSKKAEKTATKKSAKTPAKKTAVKKTVKKSSK